MFRKCLDHETKTELRRQAQAAKTGILQSHASTLRNAAPRDPGARAQYPRCYNAERYSVAAPGAEGTDDGWGGSSPLGTSGTPAMSRLSHLGDFLERMLRGPLPRRRSAPRLKKMRSKAQAFFFYDGRLRRDRGPKPLVTCAAGLVW